ncbi:MAG TPA: LpqB family beta-propeller domain-containing protein [Longimicrobiaceae bacterium]|nr:LpqB family beta-propeller domain-containing protein [Longimicrobiaceae bacterium]
MKRFTTNLSEYPVALLSIAVGIGLIGACERITDPAGEHEPETPVELTVQANLATNTSVRQLSVAVAAADIPVPIIANLLLVDSDADDVFDRAEGTIIVPSGRERTFTARAFDLEGFVTHEGTTTTQVRPNHKTVRIPLFPKEVGVPIEVIASSFSVSIDPATAELDPGFTQQFTATVTGPGGEVVENPEVTWGSGNPAVATVDASGLATAHVQGTTEIVVSYKGIAAEARITVGDGEAGKIAFVSLRDGNYEIYVVSPDGGGLIRLTNNGLNDQDPVWSPDGTKIAFGSYRDSNQEIYVMSADGSGQVNLTNNGGVDGQPVWSPDGTKIAFRNYRSDNEIYVMNADGSGQVNLTNDPGDDSYPTWSPDGTKIAFRSRRDGNYEIYAMNADGTGQTNLTNNAADDLDFTWSPDGTRIVFVSRRDGNAEIYVMNADGSGQVNLTNNPGIDVNPHWSMDGTKVAFTSDRDGNDEIYVMNADGSSQTNLTNDAGDDQEPFWSSDGTKIAFYRTPRFGTMEVYVMNADGSGQMNLTNNAAVDNDFNWSR